MTSALGGIKVVGVAQVAAAPMAVVGVQGLDAVVPSVVPVDPDRVWAAATRADTWKAQTPGRTWEARN